MFSQMCVKNSVHGGDAWQRGGGICGERGASVVKWGMCSEGDMHDEGGCAWLRGACMVKGPCVVKACVW